MNFPNARDCEHGYQRGKCPHCEIDLQANEIERLRSVVEQCRHIAEGKRVWGGMSWSYGIGWEKVFDLTNEALK